MNRSVQIRRSELARAFNQAVGDISVIVHKLMDSLTTTANPRDREVEAQKAKVRGEKRFGIRV